MLVIADSSPLIVLVNIGHIDVLPTLFGEIVIPPAVATEIASTNRPDAVRQFAAVPPFWLKVQAPSAVLTMAELHPGESEAISLAMEIHADLVLIDERKAYREAVARKLNVVGTVGGLERAANQGILGLTEAFEKLKKTDFWISHKLLDERLAMFLKQRRP